MQAIIRLLDASPTHALAARVCNHTGLLLGSAMEVVSAAYTAIDAKACGSTAAQSMAPILRSSRPEGAAPVLWQWHKPCGSSTWPWQ